MFSQAIPGADSNGKANLWARPDEPGTWIAWEHSCSMVAGELLAVREKQLKAIAARVRACPVFRDIRRHPEGVRRLDYGDIVEAGSPGARPMVVPNQGIFDMSLPKTAMQLISLPWIEEYESRVKKGATEPTVRVPLAVIEQMDWRAIAAMLKSRSPVGVTLGSSSGQCADRDSATCDGTSLMQSKKMAP